MCAAPSLPDYQRRFAGHIRDPEHYPVPADIPEPRMAVYRELFFNNFDGVLADSLPRLRSLFDPSQWRSLVRRFLAGHRARTPLLYELPGEFVAWLEDGNVLPSGVRELARFEWLVLALSLSEQEPPAPVEPAFASGPLNLSPLVRLLACCYGVHCMEPGQPPAGPFPVPLFFALFRDREERVRHLELSPLAAELLGRLAARPGQPAATLLAALARDSGAADPARFTDQGVALVQRLLAEGILWAGPDL